MSVAIEKRRRAWSSSFRELDKPARVYVFPAGEGFWEHFADRHDRPVELFREAATEALEDMGVTDFKLRWSQKAGCSCPCSPGFIVLHADGTGLRLHKDGYPADLFVALYA